MQPDIRLIVPFVAAAICAWGAARKNRNALLWGGLGFIFPLAVLFLAFLPFTCPSCRRNLTNRQWQDRTCPDCGDLRSPVAAGAGRGPDSAREEIWPPEVEARKQAVVDAQESGDPARREWAANELQNLPESLAGALAVEYELGDLEAETDIEEAQAPAKAPDLTKVDVPKPVRVEMGGAMDAMLAQARKSLLGLVYGNEQAAQRLAQYEKTGHPGASEVELYRYAAERLLRDRNRR